MLECWSFKSDMRPSFDIINQRLTLILEKYEIKRTQKLNAFDSERLFDDKAMSDLKNVGLNFAKSRSIIFNPSNNTLSSRNHLNGLTINPSITSASSTCADPLLTSASSSIMTMLSSRNTSNTSSSAISNHGLDLNKRSTRKSESEDSQYFSGADTSLLYADSSNMSSASSNYTNYSVVSSEAAVKAASVMAASLAQPPPSPPPLKPLSRLLNVASAAYQL